MTNSKIHNGGGQTHNLLKSHYKKSLFALIKATKRYYLGIWLIKLPFYAIFSESKAKKYREKRKVCYENLQIAKKRFKTIRKLAPQIKSWVESSEFKEKYANHPYPPLLNPQILDYESISADLAWELNLPLPPNYKFIWLVVWGCASNSLMRYFNINNNKTGPFTSDTDIGAYTLAFDFLCNVKVKHKILVIHINTDWFVGDKFLNLVSKKVPVFIAVREPFSIIKTWANHTKPNPNRIKEFNLTFDYHKVLDCILYEWDKKPSMDIYEVHHCAKINSFSQAKYLIHFKENKKILISVEDLSTQKVYQTMQHLSKELNFELSKNTKDYTDKKNTSTFHNLFPFILKVHNSDLQKVYKSVEHRDEKSLCYKDNIEIIIVNGIRDFWHTNDNFELLKDIESNKVYFYITKKDAQNLYDNKELFKATKEYLQGFLVALDKRIDLEAKKQLTEKDILEYFANNKTKRQEYKAMFDENLAFVKKLRPDIVESWKYYKEFEKMCAELDSI